MRPFDSLFGGINAGIEALFSIDNIALWFASALLGWCAWIILYNARRHYLPFSRQLAGRLEATAFIDDIETGTDARAAFGSSFEAIDDAMSARGPGSPGLRHGWLQFRDTLIAADDATLRATTRPEEYFLHLGDETRVLAWWANIFVAVGLTFTFLGIVAALLAAVRAMGASADPANMQVALVGLLHITAAKFWTSIGGVLSSIILRVFDRHWHSRLLRGLQSLCDRLERGTLFVSPQRLATEQIVELRRQTEALAGLRSAGGAGGGGGAAGGDAVPADGQRFDSEQMIDAARLLQAASEGLAATLDGLNMRVEGMSQRIVAEAAAGVDEAMQRTISRATEASEMQAETLTEASGEVRTMLATLARVMGEMTGVFVPLRSAAQSIETAVGATQDLLRTSDARAARGEAAVQSALHGIEQTAAAATRAWETHRERFDGVDVALATALDRIAAASTEHADALTRQVGRIDGALAQAIDRLSGSLETMGDLVAVLDDLRGDVRAAR